MPSSTTQKKRKKKIEDTTNEIGLRQAMDVYLAVYVHEQNNFYARHFYILPVLGPLIDNVAFFTYIFFLACSWCTNLRVSYG